MKKNVKTFCNPLDINYEYRVYDEGGPVCIEAADPVVVTFENDYYLFSSVTNGYWVSDDLVSWEFIECDNSKLPNIFGYAPAVMVYDGAIYFHQGYHDKNLFRNKTPKDPNTWELVTDNCYLGHDPFMYYDVIDDRIWASYGCGDGTEEYIKVVEIDKTTMEPMGEIYNCIFYDQKNRGWERPEDNHTSEGWGYTEGSQILRRGNKWYLTYSGYSLHKCYANGVYVSDSPTGPYEYAQNNPVSHKNTGFIGGAGHGCLFEDKYGNWWNVTCASVYVSHPFERRVNMYPAGFDEDGLLYVNTSLSDYPITLPCGKRDHRAQNTPYMLLSKDCKATASSVETAMPENAMYGEAVLSTQVPESRYDHRAELAFDEDIRTLWAASSRNAGEWLKADLGKEYDVKAIQLNIPTYNVQTQSAQEKYHEYTVEYSSDDVNYTAVVDTRGKMRFDPHAYYETDIKAQYVKVTFYHVAGGGFAAISDLRIFGLSDEDVPAMPKNAVAVRDESDNRNCTLTWDKAENADGYIVRYGIAPDKLYNQYQVYEETAEIRTLTNGISYFFRVDSFNKAGICNSEVLKVK
ncbi:MAG: hypothetical protein E7491_06345 [Ruminococcaceae bacterium]|nr:hypothetical protein [Oscillospiraceae bacterium]